jgi:hypothetical protein
MVFNQFLNAIDLCTIKASIALQPNWHQPKLSFVALSFDVDMRWLIPIACVTEETVCTYS